MVARGEAVTPRRRPSGSRSSATRTARACGEPWRWLVQPFRCLRRERERKRPASSGGPREPMHDAMVVARVAKGAGATVRAAAAPYPLTVAGRVFAPKSLPIALALQHSRRPSPSEFSPTPNPRHLSVPLIPLALPTELPYVIPRTRSRPMVVFFGVTPQLTPHIGPVHFSLLRTPMPTTRTPTRTPFFLLLSFGRPTRPCCPALCTRHFHGADDARGCRVDCGKRRDTRCRRAGSAIVDRQSQNKGAASARRGSRARYEAPEAAASTRNAHGA